MPRPRFDHIDPAKKARLLEAATVEFAKHGYELASINTILENAGFSKGSFYYYFDDKADLAATLIATEADASVEWAKSLTLPSSAQEFWDTLRSTSIARLKQMELQPVRNEMLMRLTNAMLKEPALAAQVMPKFAVGRAAMMGFFERGQAVGALRTDLPIATQMALVEALKTALYKSTFLGDRIPNDQELEAFTDLVIDLAKRVTEAKEAST